MDARQINKINLSKFSSKITEEEDKKFFLLGPGTEHYKLLAYLSSKQDGVKISDIGTYKGCSALALSYNQNNTIYSYDVTDMVAIKDRPKNIEFRIITDLFHKDILESQLICLDTIHDGVHEKQVIDFLIENNWKGVLVLDDIHFFPEQNKLWRSIKMKKEDVTHLGHWSGTGIIYFE